MKTPATFLAEPQLTYPATDLDGDHGAPTSPPRSHHHTPARTPTPRPSISPLSTASKPPKGSPIATRDATMRDSDLDQNNAEALDNGDLAAEIGDIPDDRSSSLSEPEDLDEDDAGLAYATNGASAAHPLPVPKSLEVDSEAETERLEESPQKLRKYAESVGKTPSKLSKTVGVEDDLSEPPSPLPTGPGAASSTSTVDTAGKASPGPAVTPLPTLSRGDANATMTGQKRKRSDAEDSPLTSDVSDIEESPRKRSHGPADPAEDDIAQTTEANGVDEIHESADPETAETVEAEDVEMPAAAPVKPVKGRRGRKPGRKPKAQEETQEVEVPEFAVDMEEEDPGVESAPKSEEEIRQKGEASTSFEDLAKQFTAFRQRLVNESLASVEHELQLLNQPDCVHPEYLRQVSCIDDRQAKQVREAHAFYRYRMQAIRERTLGERAQLHSQYYQTVRELREDMLYQLGEDWYGIQKERRQQHQEGEERFLYKLPGKKSAQIRQQAKYNQEVSVLSGVAKYVGFPAAPDIAGVGESGLEDDMKAMRVSLIRPDIHTSTDKLSKIPRRMHQPVQQAQQQQHQHHHHHHQHQHHHQPQQPQNQPQQQPQQQEQQAAYAPPPNAQMAAPSERQAHDQFLEQNAWARPQQSAIPAHGTPNLTHTPDWVDQPTGARHIMRNLAGPGQRTGSPFATPVSGKRAGFANEGMDGPSPALAAPPTLSRVPGHGISTGSPLQVGKQRQINGTPANTGERELTGFRNISNISGTSTIDAPLSAEKIQQEADRTPSNDKGMSRHLPGLDNEGHAPHQALDTSQMHRHANPAEGGMGKDATQTSASDRPKVPTALQQRHSCLEEQRRRLRTGRCEEFHNEDRNGYGYGRWEDCFCRCAFE
ncbi:hypothetical protein Q7P37_005961 [Cladosporium fusiforme]